MFLARVVGTVVATRKDPKLEGCKLLLLDRVSPEGKAKSSFLVAVDTVQGGAGDLVLVVTGSSSRMTDRTKDSPVDAAIVGIVDAVTLEKS